MIRSTYRDARRRRSGRAGERGQGLVEFAMVVVVMLLLLLGMLEFGFVFDQTLTLSYGTREGARTGAAFANGNSSTLICTTSADIDKFVVAAVQRVLEAPGSRVTIGNVSEVRIYNSNAAGVQIGSSFNRWTPGVGPTVDGVPLKFNQTTNNWNACTRDNDWTGSNPPDSLGVSVSYSYTYVTPLAAILTFFGPGGPATLPITDRTVMALNPTND